jgi:hypothetical protein
MTLKATLARLEQIALSHRQINHFFIGDFEQFANNGDINYPACFCELKPTGQISKTDHYCYYNFTIYFFDLLDISVDSGNNENDITSDLSSIAQDYVALLNYTEFQNDWGVSVDNAMNIAKYQLADLTVGVSVDITIGTIFDNNRCQVPTTGLTVETEQDRSIVQNYIYVGQGTEGNGSTFGTLANKLLLLVFKGDKLLVPTEGTPTVDEYKFNYATGQFTFGNDIEDGQIIQILNKNSL